MPWQSGSLYVVRVRELYSFTVILGRLVIRVNKLEPLSRWQLDLPYC